MTPPAVLWRADGSPFSPRFDDIYRSAGVDGLGALAQARQVFLGGCGLLAEGDAPAAWAGRPAWQILETGFGLGLNFLAAWHAWQQDPARPARLFYSAVEAYPPEAADLLRSAAPFPELTPLAEQLAARWRGLLPGARRIELAGGAVQLTLAVGDAAPMLGELTGRFDSVFLDGFSPQKNPAMWSEDVLLAVARLARPGARAASWCVAHEVRERLAACGFAVERVTGLAPKRHALAARYAPPSPSPAPASADANAAPPAPGRCAIVGAGMAGASLAYSLAVRGWQVTVLGLGDEPADGASGLPAGVFAPHVSPDDKPISRLSRAGCAATLARARALLREGIDFAATGVLERHASGERRRPESWLQAEAAQSAAARALSTRASAGLRQSIGLPGDDAHPALWHAEAGWLRPAELVRAMLAAPGIRFIGHARVARIAPHGGGWRALDDAGQPLAEAEVIALAAGYGTRALIDASLAPAPAAAAAAADDGASPPWPLNPLRGQLAFGPAPAADDAQAGAAALPPFAVNGHGNLTPRAPTPQGPIWVIGSTFERGAAHARVTPADHAANRQRLSELLPRAAAALAPQWDDGRAQAWAGVRCTVPDRLPLAGPLLDQPNAPWALAGFGSRGLTLAVLAGEIAAAALMGEPLPVERSLAHALRASRWVGRAARRGHAPKHKAAP
jgi:tRNA 5-methylaminomethyl-2-thiouridine biosynthesis bifunctional protein